MLDKTAASELARSGYHPELPPIRPDEWWFLRALGRARTVADAIEERFDGTETYFPVARCSRVVRHAKVVETRPVFPGYVYVKFERYPDWEVMRECCGASIIQRLEVDGMLRPLRERDRVITELRSREIAGDFNEGEVNPTIQKLVGTLVRIPCGTFIGQNAKVHSIENGIVKLKLWMLQRKTFISFCFDDLFTNSCEIKQ